MALKGSELDILPQIYVEMIASVLVASDGYV